MIVFVFIFCQCQVRAAISALQYFRGLPRLPTSVTIPEARNADMMDFLQYVFGFQVRA